MQLSWWLCWKWSVPNWASQRRQRQGTKTPSVTEWRKNLGRNQAQSGGQFPSGQTNQQFVPTAAKSECKWSTGSRGLSPDGCLGDEVLTGDLSLGLISEVLGGVVIVSSQVFGSYVGSVATFDFVYSSIICVYIIICARITAMRESGWCGFIVFKFLLSNANSLWKTKLLTGQVTHYACLGSSGSAYMTAGFSSC